MDDLDQINSLTDEDRQLLANLSETFDLGTQSIIGQVEYEIIDELCDPIEGLERAE